MHAAPSPAPARALAPSALRPAAAAQARPPGVAGTVLRLCSVFEPPPEALARPDAAAYDPIGGMQNHTAELTRGLDRLGVRQHVLTSRLGAPRSRTRLGRYAYAMGSNLEAARLSGIPIKRYLTTVYVIAGALAGLGGMIAASRVNSGQPNYGLGLELDVIAAAVIGGASLFGGQGTVLGTLIGAFLIALIRNGAVLLNVDVFYQSVIIGVVIWIAVFWDQYRRRLAASE